VDELLGLLARPGAPPLAPLACHADDRPRDPITGVGRGVRCLLTRRLDVEVRAAGVRATVLTPISAAALESAVDEGARAA